MNYTCASGERRAFRERNGECVKEIYFVDDGGGDES